MFFFKKNTIEKSLVFFALPKSGSKSIVNSLASIFDAKICNIGSDIYFTDDVLNKYTFFSNLDKGKILHDHIPAIPYNLKVLNYLDNYLDKNLKIIIHYRDPRHALFSFANHCRHVYKKNHSFKEFSYFLNPSLDEDVFFYDEKKFYRHFFEKYYQHFVSWIENWLSYYKTNKANILLTKYSEFKSNDIAFFNKILSFHNSNSIALIKKFNIHQNSSPKSTQLKLNKYVDQIFFDNLKKNYKGEFPQIFD